MSKTPEQRLEETAPAKKQTVFKLFLGYAPGVGKTFNMLSEGVRRHSRGEDVVIGLVETHGRAGIAELALRELALQQVTRAVDRSLEAYLEKEGLGKHLALRERIAVCVSSSPAAQYLIARAGRMAQRIEAELYVLYIDIGVDTRPEDQRSLAQNLRFAETLGAKVIRARGTNVADEVAKVVQKKHITQVVFGRSAQRAWKRYLYLSAIHRFLRDAPPVDVHIVTQEMR